MWAYHLATPYLDGGGLLEEHCLSKFPFVVSLIFLNVSKIKILMICHLWWKSVAV